MSDFKLVDDFAVGLSQLIGKSNDYVLEQLIRIQAEYENGGAGYEVVSAKQLVHISIQWRLWQNELASIVAATTTVDSVDILMISIIIGTASPELVVTLAKSLGCRLIIGFGDKTHDIHTRQYMKDWYSGMLSGKLRMNGDSYWASALEFLHHRKPMGTQEFWIPPIPFKTITFFQQQNFKLYLLVRYVGVKTPKWYVVENGNVIAVSNQQEEFLATLREMSLSNVLSDSLDNTLHFVDGSMTTSFGNFQQGKIIATQYAYPFENNDWIIPPDGPVVVSQISPLYEAFISAREALIRVAKYGLEIIGPISSMFYLQSNTPSKSPRSKFKSADDAYRSLVDYAKSSSLAGFVIDRPEYLKQGSVELYMVIALCKFYCEYGTNRMFAIGLSSITGAGFGLFVSNDKNTLKQLKKFADKNPGVGPIAYGGRISTEQPKSSTSYIVQTRPSQSNGKVYFVDGSIDFRISELGRWINGSRQPNAVFYSEGVNITVAVTTLPNQSNDFTELLLDYGQGYMDTMCIHSLQYAKAEISQSMFNDMYDFNFPNGITPQMSLLMASQIDDGKYNYQWV